jgi:hypothetical protein
MLLDAIAALCLAAMMLVPLLNVVVGAIVGAAYAGWLGVAAGMLFAAVTSVAEVRVLRRRSEARAVPDKADRPAGKWTPEVHASQPASANGKPRTPAATAPLWWAA